MRQTTLAGQDTSRVGFGCGRLVGGAGARASRTLVEQMLALGIRHFDTAPSYGLGLSEDVLGDVLGDSQDVTVITKVGLPRPGAPGLKALARQILLPMLSRAPAIKERLARAAGRSEGPRFTPGGIEVSLGESLRRLRRSSVTGLLLHEMSLPAMTAEVAQAMQAQQARGHASALGSGTGKGLGELVPFGTIRQYRWASDDPPSDGDELVHGVLRFFPRPANLVPWQEERLRELGRDPRDPSAWTGLSLTAALMARPRAVVLVSSTQAERLAQALAAIDWGMVDEQAPERLRSMLEVLGGRGEPCPS